MSILDSTGSTKMKIYKDESCLDLLGEYDIDFEVIHFEDAANFNQTMLFELLCEVEDEYLGNWAAVAIYDGNMGTVLYRNRHYLLAFDYKPKLTVIPRIIYFDVSDAEHIRSSFSPATVHEVCGSKLNDVSAFIFGRDEFVWRLVNELNSGNKSPYKTAFVVMAHEAKSETWYLLNAKHRGMIRIKDAQHLEGLEILALRNSLSRKMSSAAYDCVCTAEFYGIDVTPYEQAKELAEQEISRIRTSFETDFR